MKILLALILGFIPLAAAPAPRADPGCLLLCVPLISASPPPKAPCLGDGVSGNRVQLFYGQVVGEQDDSSTAISSIRTNADGANQGFVTAGNQDVRWVCSGRQTVIRILLPGRTLSTVTATLKAKGYSRTDRIYVVALKTGDATTSGFSGFANLPHDDSTDVNKHLGPQYSVVYSYSGPIWHELSHNLGAVQNSAPHSTGAGHCYDGRDLMCYRDGGSYFQNGGQMQNRCSTLVYDCGKDDYYSPNPPAGSYLSTHWNVFRSVFLQRRV